jgi:hypothetical protein
MVSEEVRALEAVALPSLTDSAALKRGDLSLEHSRLTAERGEACGPNQALVSLTN